MSIFREIPPTAGFPLPVHELFASWAKTRYPGSLEEDFITYLNVAYARIVCSGTAGLFYIASALAELSDKRTVVVPAFICPSVVPAIIRAGFKVLVCDVRAGSFDYDVEALAGMCRDNADIAAVLVMHLAGLPADMDPVLAIARLRNIHVIEDCAQSLGAEYHGRKVGSLGDFSFFSLARGKGLTTYEGGVVVCNSSRASEIVDKKITELEQENFLDEALMVLKLAGYVVFYRPSLFWWAYRLPELFWHLTGQKMRELSEYFSFDFPVIKVSPLRIWAGHAGFSRLETEIGRQRRMAERYRDALRGVPGITFMREPPNSRATFPYLALLLEDEKPGVLTPLKESAWGISESFSAAIPEYEGLKGHVTAGDCPHARALSRRILTLSTSVFLTEAELAGVCRLIKGRCFP
ncbi:MAG: DegT/DnrJ/EryC1/StrS family aminotransferase [Candidatus Omnitrophica bacterium]|nr:DegT/DnrJ/EryC1/StrS family aminotransferase [Candidatus Omnitrophota bacterium]